MLFSLLPALYWRIAWPLALAGGIAFGLYGWRFRAEWRALGPLGGAANWATLLRLLGLLGMAVLHRWVFPDPLAFWALMILVLDGLDGWLARRTGTESTFGAAFDKEVDALFVLVGCFLLWQRERLELWVLLAGVMRYLYAWLRHWLPVSPGFEPRLRWGRYVAGGLMAALVAAFILPEPWHGLAMGLATGAVLGSFGFSLYLLFHPDQLARTPRQWLLSPVGRQAAFWVSLVALNLALLLPQYLAYQQLQRQRPASTLSWQEGSLMAQDTADFDPQGADQPAAWWLRNRNDLARVNVELMLLVGLMVALRRRPPLLAWVRGMGVAFYLFLLAFAFYYAYYTSIYGRHPQLWSDLLWAADVLPIFLGQIVQTPGKLIGTTLLGLLGGGLFFYGAYRGLSLGLTGPLWPRAASWAMGFLCLLALGGELSARTYWRQVEGFRDHYLTFRPLLEDFWQSTQNGPASHQEPLHQRVEPYYAYLDTELTERPDVYLIFIESYGQVLLANPRYRDTMGLWLDSLEQDFRAEGWHMASGMSVSPVAGGGSWMAFSSAMLGVEITVQPQFKQIVQSRIPYPHLVNFFNRQGYATHRMKTMGEWEFKEGNDSAHQAVNRLFGFDGWLRLHHFPYQGFKFDYFGGIPDQYALNYFQSEVAPVDSPLFFFTITMNSHHPWFLPAPVLNNWRDLDRIQSNPDPRAPADATTYPDWQVLTPGDDEARYLETIGYEWQVLSDWIQNRIDAGSTVILMGDHQPGVITDYEVYGKQAPFHILSQDSAFIQSFAEEGLQLQMRPSLDATPELHHAGFLSLFMRHFLRRYGTPRTQQQDWPLWKNGI